MGRRKKTRAERKRNLRVEQTGSVKKINIKAREDTRKEPSEPNKTEKKKTYRVLARECVCPKVKYKGGRRIWYRRTEKGGTL